MIVVVDSSISTLACLGISHFFGATHVKLPKSQAFIQCGHALCEDLAIALQIYAYRQLI